MILLSNIITSVLLFLLSLLMPIVSFSLPVYKIKRMDKLTYREKIVANVVIVMIIGLINISLLYYYIGFFMIVEFLYYSFNEKFINVKRFDRVVITSIIVTVILGLLMLYLKDDINQNIQFLMEFYEKNLQLSKAESLLMFEEIKDNSIYYIFIYTILNIFMMYISLDLENYENWEISFEWLLLYVFGYFSIHLFKIDNFYINNIFNIGEMIFIV